MLSLPRKWIVRDHAHGLPELPFTRLPKDQQSESRARQYPGNVRELPQHNELAKCEIRPQSERIQTNRSPYQRRLRFLSCGRQL